MPSADFDNQALTHESAPITAGRILVVDNDPAIRRLLNRMMGVLGYKVFEASSAAKAFERLAETKIDLVILELDLPDGDGRDIIHKLRLGSRVPIIVLSTRNDELGKVQALDAGANDYVTKPFGVEELAARIRTAFRHCIQSQGVNPIFEYGGLCIDLVSRRITRDGIAIKLSPKEYDVLQQLVIHAGKVLTHRHLLREVWGADNEDDVAYLRVYMRQLRGKLESNPANPALMLTEPGVGYRLSVS
ncbi:response regulator [Nevskia soli]|uniref:response regulator n=1 Tax=Nevskia soli TaxID=418856 RepID=UPI001B807B63|nr:response regulator [Nevskia soli]